MTRGTRSADLFPKSDFYLKNLRIECALCERRETRGHYCRLLVGSIAIWLSGKVSEASRFASPSGANRDGSPTFAGMIDTLVAARPGLSRFRNRNPSMEAAATKVTLHFSVVLRVLREWIRYRGTQARRLIRITGLLIPSVQKLFYSIPD